MWVKSKHDSGTIRVAAFNADYNKNSSPVGATQLVMSGPPLLF